MAEALAAEFEQHRPHLRHVAYRMLGSTSEADDAVQEAWLKLTRADTSEVDNLRGWLTTVTARVCLDSLRARTSRREDSLTAAPEVAIGADATADRELVESVGAALLVVLNKLDPAERLAFVLHDSCAMSFDQIAPIIGKSSGAARQLASRARRRIQGANAPSVEIATQRGLVESFIAALRAGDIEGLIAVLDPDAVVRVEAGEVAQVSDARTWASGAVAFKGAAQHMRPVLLDGAVALALAPNNGKIIRVLVFSFVGAKIHGAEVVMDPDALAEMTISELA
jgi:RNA polymerase sigma-70 factor (ECF subfamily)